MNIEFGEEKVSTSAHSLVQSVLVPDEIIYEPDDAMTMSLKIRKPLKTLLTVACTLLIGVALVFSFTKGFLFMPALGSFQRDKNTITHTTESITEIEQGSDIHKVLSAYILNGRIYLDVFFYKTDLGMKFSPQSFPDYWLYYNGKKCGDYSKSYGSAISLSYKMPSVKKGEPMQVSLYSGEDFISDIELLPTDDSIFTKERPHSTIDGITLLADVQPLDNKVQVFISAILPKDADRGVKSDAAFVNNCLSGFSEDDVYIQDTAGNIYVDNSIDSFDESVHMHRTYHILFFDVPNDVNEFTIIIPKITYSSNNKNNRFGSFVEKYGPWKIEVEVCRISSNS